MQDRVLEELKRHLASAEHVDVSQYQFINLDAVRAAAGTMWDSVRSRVFLAAETMIRRRLATHDLLICCASGFLVVFRDTEGPAAQRITNEITAEMERFFLGDAITKLLSVESSCEQLTIAEFAATLDAADVDDSAVSAPGRAQVRELAARREIEELVFWPAWDPRREAVACFSAAPRRRARDGSGWEWTGEMLAGRPGPDPRLGFDLAVLTRVHEALEALHSQNARCGVITPVGYASLAHGPSRTRYAAALTTLPSHLRKLVFLKVEATPLDAPAAQINESCRSVLACCGRLMLHAPLEALSLARFADTGATLVGATLPASPGRGLAQDIERFCALARRNGSKVYFDGVADWGLLKAALASPAQLLIGPAFGEFGVLQAPYRLPRARALSQAA